MLQVEQILQKRYQLKTKLGENAGRQTWLAQDLDESQSVIVKLLAFNPQMHWDEVKLFEREALVLKNLHYPQIPQYRDYFGIDQQTGEGLPWFGLVQEYLPGNSLQQLLAQGKRFTEKQVRKITTSVLEILIYLHELSPPVFHRDIKPSNLILGKDNQIYLVDFGAVQDRAKAEGVTFTVVGTSGYTPPEQFWGRAIPASDLYALGATLIHLLTGIAPADLPQHQMRIQFADKVNLSLHFNHWLEKLTEPAAERRYHSARQALEALQSGYSPGYSTAKASQPASSLVSYRHLAGLFLVQLLILSFGASILLPKFLNPTIQESISPEPGVYLNSMNRAQQAYFLEKSTFAGSLGDLKLDLTTPTTSYNYSTRATEFAAFNYGVSQQNTLKSYVGGVFVIPATEFGGSEDEMTTISILCQANSPGVIQPQEPIYEQGKLACGSGTTYISGY
ncbi:MAG: protein kinase [Symploca sp. SIO2G7]|nr:protein kinase [Symploca sp. SIO2G7]